MQILVNGFISGLATALVAMAFQCVYLPTRIFFIGLAGIYSIAPFIAHSALENGLSWPAAAAAAVVSACGVAVAIEVLAHGPLSRKRSSDGAHLITSLGIYIVLVQAISILWGDRSLTLRTGLDGVTTLGDVVITNSQWLTLAVAISLVVTFAVALFASGVGLRLRAMADNSIQFALWGYNLDYYRAGAFAVAGGFAGTSSLLTAYEAGFDPYTGLNALLLGIAAVIIGGRSSFLGPVVAAIAIGALRAEVVWYGSARWQDAITFALLALFLLFLPDGLFGRKLRTDSQD